MNPGNSIFGISCCWPPTVASLDVWLRTQWQWRKINLITACQQQGLLSLLHHNKRTRHTAAHNHCPDTRQPASLESVMVTRSCFLHHSRSLVVNSNVRDKGVTHTMAESHTNVVRNSVRGSYLVSPGTLQTVLGNAQQQQPAAQLCMYCTVVHAVGTPAAMQHACTLRNTCRPTAPTVKGCFCSNPDLQTE